MGRNPQPLVSSRLVLSGRVRSSHVPSCLAATPLSRHSTIGDSNPMTPAGKPGAMADSRFPVQREADSASAVASTATPLAGLHGNQILRHLGIG